MSEMKRRFFYFLICFILLGSATCFSDTLPDLTVTSVKVLSDVAIIGGDDFFVKFTFANITTESPYSNTATWGNMGYFSKDRIFDESDIAIATMSSACSYDLDNIFSVDLIKAGYLNPNSNCLPTQGDYYIIYSVDDTQMNQINHYPGVTESNEENNWLASSKTITVIPEPATLLLLGLGGLVLRRKTRHRI